MNRALVRVLSASVLMSAMSCNTLMLNAVGVTTDAQDFDALIGQPIRRAELQWGMPDRTVVRSDSTVVHTWDDSARVNREADSTKATRKTPPCVKSLIVSREGKITGWSANKACSKFLP